MSRFHIIQPVVVNQKNRSPGLSSSCRAKALQVLEDDAAVPVHDALGQPGGAGGVEHPQRVVERHRVELQLGRGRR